MFTNNSGALVCYIRSLVEDERSSTMADDQLLERFLASGDQQAFAALVQRHAQLVWGVSRRVLDREHDAEDVFQATFLVLAKKAGSICRRQALASWLFGVANRIARKVKRDAGRRQSREKQACIMTQQDRHCEATFRELERLLDAELLLLPEKYRAPFVLCALHGLSTAEAARQLGWKIGTVSGRLCCARKKLQKRLALRGVTTPAIVCASVVSAEALRASPPADLLRATICAALQFRAGRSMAHLIPTNVAALAKGVLKAMLVARLKVVFGLLLAVGLCTTGAGTIPRQSHAGDRQAPPNAGIHKNADAVPPGTTANADEKQKALAEFAKHYALKPGEVLKRIATPFPPSRFVYHRQHYPNDDKAEDMMFLRWDTGLQFSGTLGCVKSDPPKVQLVFLLRNLPMMIGDLSPLGHDGRRELDVRCDSSLLAMTVEGDFVCRTNVPFEKILARMGEILRDECKLPVRLTLRSDPQGVNTLLVERQGQSARQASSLPSAAYVLTEKDKDIPKPAFDQLDYAKPAAYLFLEKSMGNPARIRKVALGLVGTTPEQKIIAIARWIDSHLKVDDACAYAWRDFDAIVDDGRYGGCADHSVVFGALLRACGIPCVWVKTMDIDWIQEFVGNGGSCRNWRGHVYLEVYLENRWMLLDASQLVLYRNYQTTERILPGRRYAYDKGASPYELILSPRWEIWKKQTAAHFLHFDLDRLPLAFQQGKNLRDQGGVFITTITKMAQSDWTATWQQTSQRCSRLGYPVRLSFRGDYARLLARTKGNYLIVACVGDDFVLDERLCATYLPWSLSDLRMRLEKEPKGCLHGKTPDGTRVALVFAKDYQTLRTMFDELTLD